jgi:hypothetical protein
VRTDDLGSWHYRLRLRLWRKFRGRDLLGVLLFILAAWLGALGNDLRYVVPIVVAYFVLALWRALLIVQSRESRHQAQGIIIQGLFDFINKELFGRSNRTRFTIFKRAPYRSAFIIPWWRFRIGGKDAVQEADASQARYREGEGITGRVWAQPADELTLQVFPQFDSHAVMEAFYIDTFGVSREIAGSISDYMVQVRAIVSYAFLDGRDHFIGLLSLDIRDAEVVLNRNERRIDIRTPDAALIVVDADKLFLLTRALGNVLESFQLAERRAP